MQALDDPIIEISRKLKQFKLNVFRPRDYQKPLIEAMNNLKRAVIVWHRKSGKDLTCLNIMIEKMKKRQGQYYYLFPTYSQGKKILWDGIDNDGVPYLDRFPKQLLENKPNETELKIKMTGSLFQIIGTDDIDRIIGPNPIGCIFSEYSLQDPRAWNLLRPILVANDGWAIFNFTPRGKNHAERLYRMAKESPDWFCQLLTINDTRKEDGSPIISQEAIERERKENMPEELIRQEYYCSFEGYMEGSYYHKQIGQAEKDGRITKVPWMASIPVDTWWDLGISDSMAIWFTQTVGREIRVIDYYEASGEGIAYYAKMLQEKPYVYGRHVMPHDAEAREIGTGKSRKDEALNLGIRPIDVQERGKIEDGINAVRSIFSRCWFDSEKCARGLDALRHYHKEWNDKLQEFKSRPHHDWSSHGADAFRTFAMAYRENYSQKPLEVISSWDPFRKD